MDMKRVILGAALAMLAYSLWTAWQIDYPKPQKTSSAQAMHRADANLLPKLEQSDAAQTAFNTRDTYSAQPEVSNHQNIQIKTDVLELKVNLAEGDIVSAKLLDYAQNDTHPESPFILLNNKENERYVANSSLLVLNQGVPEAIQPGFKAAQSEYHLAPDQAELKIKLTGQTNSGLIVHKILTLKRGEYLIDVRYQLENQGNAAWRGYFNTQLLRDLPQEDKSSLSHIGSYTGASYSNPGHHRYQKLTFKAMDKTPLNVNVEGGWVAMQQRYFLTAWIPNQDAKNRLYSRANYGDYAIGAVSQAIQIAPGATHELAAKLYLGPEISDILKPIADGLDLTIDYGWLWFISSLLFSIMKAIYAVVGNWGWAIVLVTVLVKLAFYRLSAKSYRSMASMRQLQPKLQALKDKYGDDKAKISQATMALYRDEKVNPLSGCLPMLVQLPIFMALYWVLIESVELRQAPFIFWIKDLASPDPYHVLTLLMGGTMLIQQKMNPAPPDPMQAKMMMLLPVLMTALFWNFPSGLALYWTVNNTLTILQQWYITRKFSPQKAGKS